jgi:hypothetical protein
MSKYRIRKSIFGSYYVQVRFLFFFWRTIEDYVEMPIYFTTLEKAKEAIKVWEHKDEIVGEY